MSLIVAVPYAQRPRVWPGRRLVAEVVGLNGQPVRYYRLRLRRRGPRWKMGRLARGRRV